MIMFVSVVLAPICLLIVGASHWETCEDVIARERDEDWRYHSCRACKFLPLDALSNCPKMGYDCDEDFPTTSNVLRDGCECSQLRCASASATLTVNRTLIGKVRCMDSKWTTSSGDVAASGVCARKCGLGVCKQSASSNSLFGPMDSNPPDDQHPCAWGECEGGAIGSTGASNVPYDGQVQFSCAGDGKWKGPDGKKHDTVQCVLELPCGKLPLWDATECSATGATCEDPNVYTATKFVCPGERKIVFPYTPADVRSPDSIICANGVWWYDLTSSDLGFPGMVQDQFNSVVPEAGRKFSCR